MKIIYIKYLCICGLKVFTVQGGYASIELPEIGEFTILGNCDCIQKNGIAMGFNIPYG